MHLSRRFQTTAIPNNIYNKKNAFVGMGSVLGPLLFLLYINDICVSSSKFNFYLFADGTSILYSHKNIRVLEQIVNSGQQNVCHWLEANKLTLNSQKSNFVTFHTEQKALVFIPNIKIIDLTTKTMIPLQMNDTELNILAYLSILT